MNPFGKQAQYIYNQTLDQLNNVRKYGVDGMSDIEMARRIGILEAQKHTILNDIRNELTSLIDKHGSDAICEVLYGLSKECETYNRSYDLVSSLKYWDCTRKSLNNDWV